MPLGGAINQVTQIGPEATKGTVVPATRRLQSLAIEMANEMDFGRILPRGQKVPSAHPLNREWSSGDVSGGGAFNEIQYGLAGVLSKATAIGLVKTFVANMAVAVGDFVKPSAANGFMYRVTASDGAAGAVAPAFPVAPGGEVSADGVTYRNVGPDTIVAFDWLFNTSAIGIDDVQSYTIEQVDLVRNRGIRAAYCLFNALGISSGRSDEVSVSGEIIGRNLAKGITPTTAGIQVATIVPMTTAQVDVFFADTPAGLEVEANKLAYNFAYSVEYGGRFSPAWVHDTSLASFKEHVESEPSFELSLTLADDAFADSILSDAKVGDRNFCRFRVNGPPVNPAHPEGPRNQFIWDAAIQVSDAPSADDQDDAYVQEISFEAEMDGGWNKFTQAKLVNANSAL